MDSAVSKVAHLTTAHCYHKLLLSRGERCSHGAVGVVGPRSYVRTVLAFSPLAAIWGGRIMVIVGLVLLSGCWMRTSLYSSVQAIRGGLSLLTVYFAGSCIITKTHPGESRGAGQTAGKTAFQLAQGRAEDIAAEASVLLHQCGAAIIAASAAVALNATVPSACDSALISILECQSAFSCSAVAILGLAWVRT